MGVLTANHKIELWANADADSDAHFTRIPQFPLSQPHTLVASAA